MLQKLAIRNYAIIEELNISFDNKMNVITGETGAGKSIILGALSLILGERADTSVLINKQEKCIVEAHFAVENNDNFTSTLIQFDLDVEPICIIRREINTSGKSRAFVNDTPVTLQTLNTLTPLLVDMHRQFDTYHLLANHFLFNVIDAVAGTQQELSTFQNELKTYKTLQQQLNQLVENKANFTKEADYKQYLFDELDQASFKENEIEEASSSLKTLSNAEQILATLQGVYYHLEDGEMPLTNELKRLSQQLQSIANLEPESDDLSDRMNSVVIELKDIADSISQLQHKVEMNPEQLQVLQERIDLGYRLLKKHNVQTTDELIAIQQQLSSELEKQNNTEYDIEVKKKQLDEVESTLRLQAQSISTKRINASKGFEEKLNQLLALVGMPNAQIKVSITPRSNLDNNGSDDINFLLDANKSGQFAPIQKAASGGELSRIMLCIKTITAKAMQLPTLIFDEVDTGISGEAARQVGILLKDISGTHQVICITHQPQIAGKGTQHFYVYKSEDETQSIKTKIKLLNNNEHIMAIAKMIGGDKPSEAALENAKELANN